MSPTSQNHRRQRPCRSPHGAADALVVEHLHFAAKVAATYARRTGHPKEGLTPLRLQAGKPQQQLQLHRLRQAICERRDHSLPAR